MKIAVRAGHNEQSTGSNGIINEVAENRPVTNYVIKYLRELGHEVLDVTPGRCDYNNDLAYGVNKANEWKADLFISIHFNAIDEATKWKIGSEVCTWSEFPEAIRVADNLYKIGFCNSEGKKRRNSTKGLNINKGLYEIRNTTMPAMIVEICFVNSEGDVATYKNIGPNEVGKSIAEGIANKKVPPPPKPESGNVIFRVVTGSYANRGNAEAQVKKLKNAGFDSFITIYESES